MGTLTSLGAPKALAALVFAVISVVAAGLTFLTYLLPVPRNAGNLELTLELTIGILAIVVLNALIGLTQERAADRTAEVLQGMHAACDPGAARRPTYRAERGGAGARRPDGARGRRRGIRGRPGGRGGGLRHRGQAADMARRVAIVAIAVGAMPFALRMLGGN
ncbi:MAG: hypothetical protein ACYCTE_15415, partial [Acidimicrobiales bacterium]